MKMRNNSLRKMRSGLWATPCGRFTVKRLGNGAWVASATSSPRRCGSFSSPVARNLAAQRFGTRRDAADALFAAIEMQRSGCQIAELTWRRTHEGYYSEVDNLEQVAFVQRRGNLWIANALPAKLYSAISEEESGNHQAMLSMLRQRAQVHLGTARSLTEIKQIVAEEAAA